MNGRNPDFILIGAMKAGTSVTIRMLGQHRQIKTVQDRFGEVHFFDNPKKWVKGVEWYRGLFANCNGKIAGEKTPRYMSDVKAMILMQKFCPDVKLIAILRDPVVRFISHRTFQTFGRNPKGNAEIFWRGCYAPQLQNVFGLFPRDRVHILFNESLREDTEGEIKKIYAFLGADPVERVNVRRSNRRSGQDPKWDSLKKELAERYRPYNQALIQLLPDREEEINRWLGMTG